MFFIAEREAILTSARSKPSEANSHVQASACPCVSKAVGCRDGERYIAEVSLAPAVRAGDDDLRHFVHVLVGNGVWLGLDEVEDEEGIVANLDRLALECREYLQLLNHKEERI